MCVCVCVCVCVYIWTCTKRVARTDFIPVFGSTTLRFGRGVVVPSSLDLLLSELIEGRFIFALERIPLTRSLLLQLQLNLMPIYCQPYRISRSLPPSLSLSVGTHFSLFLQFCDPFLTTYTDRGIDKDSGSGRARNRETGGGDLGRKARYGALLWDNGVKQGVKSDLPRVRGRDGPVKRQRAIFEVHLAIVLCGALHVEGDSGMRGRLDKVMPKPRHGYGRRWRHSHRCGGGSGRGRRGGRWHLACHLLVNLCVAFANPVCALSCLSAHYPPALLSAHYPSSQSVARQYRHTHRHRHTPHTTHTLTYVYTHTRLHYQGSHLIAWPVVAAY